jgi:hypothetical protein
MILTCANSFEGNLIIFALPANIPATNEYAKFTATFEGAM